MKNKSLNLGLDIDETITENPAFFALLSRSVKKNNGKIYIVTSRFLTIEIYQQTIDELNGYGIVFDEIYFTPDSNEEAFMCPHDEFSIFEKIQWHKVWFCLEKGVDVFFDDDPVVVSFFRKYAPEITIFQSFGVREI